MNALRLSGPWVVAGLALGCVQVPATEVSPRTPADRLAWWREARFGLFVHWGLYSIPAGEWNGEEGTSGTDYGEWIRDSAHIPIERYEELRSRFQPVDFDADQWVSLAQEAGMGYVVVTTKHHDGFCLFDSRYTDFDVGATPFGRDVMREIAQACRRHGLEVGWYHSIMDWHHGDYLPRRGWERRSAEGADFARYRRYLFGQVEELLSNYGPIGVLWFDGEWEETWTHEDGVALYDHCRALQPDVIVNNRVDKGRGGMAGMTQDSRYRGDFGTPEQEVPAQGAPGVDWESCMTMNRHWGYNKNDHDFKSTAELLHTLIDVVSKGGNLLLNVGPTERGAFPPECVQRLREIGAWMRTNGEAIGGTQASPFAELAFGRCTQKEVGERTRLYFFLFERPADGALVIPGLGSEVQRAWRLGEDRPLVAQRRGTDVVIALPAPSPELVEVIALEVEGRPVVYVAPRIAAEASVLVDRLEVRLEGGSEELAIHFTLDGSEPGADSPRYERPIELTRSATVCARAFHRGQPVSAVSRASFQKVEPIPGRRLEGARPGLLYERYTGDWDELPAFAELRADEIGSYPGVALPRQPAGEFFGLRISGWIRAERDDVYRFALESDDGSRLSVAGKRVVDNDGLHGTEEREGVVALGAGWHPILVEYFNKTGSAALGLRSGRLGEELRPVEGFRAGD